jgi:hypothetical protein
MSDSPAKTPQLDDATILPVFNLPEAPVAASVTGPISGFDTEKAALHDHGLTDQTNYLPTRQVITVFAGLNLAVMVGFLDQTMFVYFTFTPLSEALTEFIAASRLPFLELLLIFTLARNLHGLQHHTSSPGLPSHILT